MRERTLRRVDQAVPATGRRLPASGFRPVQTGNEVLAHPDVVSQRLFAAAMAGEFVCVFCSHPGPHDDIGHGQGSEIAFSCARCGKHLDESALKRSVARKRAAAGSGSRNSTS